MRVQKERSAAMRREGWLDQTALNLIRFVIGSYFVAVAFGYAQGFDAHVLARLFLPEEQALLVGTYALSAIAGVFILGFALRITSLLLAGFMVTSSLVPFFANGFQPGSVHVWENIALGAAVMLCYGPLKRHELHEAALIRTAFFRGLVARLLHKDVAPRRVKVAEKRERDKNDLRPMRPLIAPTERMMAMGDADGKPERNLQMSRLEDDGFEPHNIFANL